MDTKQAAGTFGKKNGTRINRRPKPPAGDKQSEAARKDIVAATREGAPATKTRKAAQSSRATSKSEKLLCRYCGSDDLAPSFKKRRDARCRACFKKRYGSAARGKKAKRATKAKAAK